RRIAFRGARLVHAHRPAGKDQAARLQLRDALGRQVMAYDLAKDVQFAHPPGDQLPVLSAEIEDQNALVAHEWLYRRSHLPPNSFDRLVAASTASINADRRPPRSKTCNPAIVVPPGLVTWSFKTPMCSFVSSTIRAAPSTV